MAEANAKQNIMAVGAVIVLIVAGYFILRQTALKGPRNQGATSMYIYDLATGQLSAGMPGPDVIRASVFSCTSCDNESDRFIANIQKTTPEAAAESQKEQPDPSIIEAGQLIAEPSTNPDWKPLSSIAGQALVEAVYTKCESPQACRP